MCKIHVVLYHSRVATSKAPPVCTIYMYIVHDYCTTGKYIDSPFTLDQRTEFNAHQMFIPCIHTWNQFWAMHIESAHLQRWFGCAFKQDCIIIYDSCKVTRSFGLLIGLTCGLCGICYIVTFCSALATTLEKKDACILMVKKTGTAQQNNNQNGSI